MFVLHPQLERDTFFVADFPLCRLLLMNNRLYPWVILVPRQENAREIIDLGTVGTHTLMDEITAVSHILNKLFSPYKINVATLGNQVEQLHIHVIARFREDAAWPHPVWGKAAEPYNAAEASRLVERFRFTSIRERKCEEECHDD